MHAALERAALYCPVHLQAELRDLVVSDEAQASGMTFATFGELFIYELQAQIDRRVANCGPGTDAAIRTQLKFSGAPRIMAFLDFSGHDDVSPERIAHVYGCSICYDYGNEICFAGPLSSINSLMTDFNAGTLWISHIYKKGSMK